MSFIIAIIMEIYWRNLAFVPVLRSVAHQTGWQLKRMHDGLRHRRGENVRSFSQIEGWECAPRKVGLSCKAFNMKYHSHKRFVGLKEALGSVYVFTPLASEIICFTRNNKIITILAKFRLCKLVSLYTQILCVARRYMSGKYVRNAADKPRLTRVTCCRG